MGRWAVTEGADDLFIVETLPGGKVSLRIPSPDPLVVTWVQAEQIRMLIGSAIGDAQAVLGEPQ